jgi:hypothetical protein
VDLSLQSWRWVEGEARAGCRDAQNGVHNQGGLLKKKKMFK